MNEPTNQNETVTISTAEYHAAVDAIRAESESLIAHQPGPFGCLEAGRRLGLVADRLGAVSGVGVPAVIGITGAMGATGATSVPEMAPPATVPTVSPVTENLSISNTATTATTPTTPEITNAVITGGAAPARRSPLASMTPVAGTDAAPDAGEKAGVEKPGAGAAAPAGKEQEGTENKA